MVGVEDPSGHRAATDQVMDLWFVCHARKAQNGLDVTRDGLEAGIPVQAPRLAEPRNVH